MRLIRLFFILLGIAGVAISVRHLVSPGQFTLDSEAGIGPGLGGLLSLVVGLLFLPSLPEEKK